MAEQQPASQGQGPGMGGRFLNWVRANHAHM